MRAVSEADAKRRFADRLKTARREPIVVRRQNRDVAGIVSSEEYEKIRRVNIAAMLPLSVPRPPVDE